MIGIATTITSPAFLLQKNHSFCLLLLFILCHCIIPSLSVPLGQERRNFAPCWPCRYVDYHYNEIGYLFAACNLYESLYSSLSLSVSLLTQQTQSARDLRVGGLGLPAVYIDTEGAFSAQRFVWLGEPLLYLTLVRCARLHELIYISPTLSLAAWQILLDLAIPMSLQMLMPCRLSPLT